MKPTLQFRLSQHLTLTPQLQQSIRLLQLSTVELNQEIERMLMENPILEREDVEGDAQAAFTPPRDATQSASEAATQTAEDTAERSDDWLAELGAPAWRGEDDEEGDRAFAAPDTPTLRDHLNQQLPLTGIG
jgi:RNA polymerase sigma-54 factor